MFDVRSLLPCTVVVMVLLLNAAVCVSLCLQVHRQSGRRRRRWPPQGSPTRVPETRGLTARCASLCPQSALAHGCDWLTVLLRRPVCRCVIMLCIMPHNVVGPIWLHAHTSCLMQCAVVSPAHTR